MYLTIDIGGTKTLIALFDKRGRIVREKKFPTPENLQDFLNKLFAQLQFSVVYQPKNIVVAVPGIVQANRPVWFGNRDWKNPPLYETIRQLFTCPIYFKNDSDLAAFYEASFYPKKRTMFLTFGTGIGGSLAKDGGLTRSSATFEPGHQIITWKKKELEWEDLASAQAIRRANGNKDVTTITDKYACDLIAAKIAIGLVPIIIEKRPEVVIIGGPLGETFRYYRSTLNRLLKIGLKGQIPQIPKLVKARKPRECVSYGAFELAKRLDAAAENLKKARARG